MVEHFDWIHSVDSLKLFERINQQAQELGRCPRCCLQVKLAPDPSKAGFEPNELWAALPAMNQALCQSLAVPGHLQLAGLMVIPPYGLQPLQLQAVFEQGQALAERIGQYAQQQGWQQIGMDELSMGMSGDFELAIAAGATLVRIGSGLFGQRAQVEKS